MNNYQDVRVFVPTKEEVEQHFAIGLSMWAEGAYSKFDLDIARAKAYVFYWLDHPDNFFFRLAEINGKPVGFIAGQIQQTWFSNVKFASDFALYVMPLARGKAIGFYLLDEFKRWAFEKGAQRIVLANSVGIDRNASDAVYRRVGAYPAIEQYIIEREE